ncbi:MAG: toxin TcdB middle/N-terminal domain-containing protein, partial [Bacillota bacterium]
PWTSGRLRAGDLDGDGRVDALYAGSRAFALYYNRAEEGWSDPQLAPVSEDGPDVSFTDPLVHLADMTGDGLLDIVRIRSGRVEYWPSLGHGRFGPRQLLFGSPRLPGITDAPHELLLLDLDGDGCADLVRLSATGRLEVWFNQGGARLSAPLVREGLPAPIPGTLRPADMTGSGRPGLLYNSYRSRGTGYVYCDLAAEPAPYLLTAIDHGTGLTSSITYRSVTVDALRDRAQGEAWETYLPFPVQVVAATSEEDRLTGRTAATLYEYHAGHFDPRTRQFQGFSRVEKREQGDESRPDVRTVYHFLIGQDLLPGHGPEHAALNRLLHRVELFGMDGSPAQERPYQVEESEHGFTLLDQLPDGQQRLFLFVRRSRVRYIDRTEEERVEERTYSYDEHGNVVREEFRAGGVRAGAPQPELQLVTEVAYAQNPARGIFDKIAHVIKRDGSGRLLGEIRRYYDGPDFHGLPLGQVDRGLMSREEQLVLDDETFAAHYAGMDTAALGYTPAPNVDGEPGWWVQRERCAYDGRGLRTRELDPLGQMTTVEWDAAGLFRTARTDSQGTGRVVYDPALGQPLVVTDPDGSQVTMAYDALGRVVQVVLPGDTPAHPSRRYQYEDAAIPGAIHVFYRQAPGLPDELHAVTYFDGAGKEMQKRVGMAPGRVMVSAWLERNRWGQTRAEYEPTIGTDFAFAIPDLAGRPQRRFFYDAAGRPVRTVNYNGGESTVTHSPWALTMADANGRPRTEEYDAMHRRIAVTEMGDGGPVTTRYQLDELGRLLSYSDGSGEVARHTWDLLGNRLSIRHREAGERRLWYDAARRVVRTVDGRGHDVRAAYDPAGRLAQVSLDGAPVERYTYNAPGPGGWGRLAEVSYPGGRQRFTYTPRGQVESQTWEMEGQPGPWTIAYEYNGLGRETRAIYPGGQSVEQQYYANGLLRAIPGFIEEIEYDARSLPVRVRYANGVTTEVAYTPGPGRVAHQRTTGPHGQVYSDLQYGFDPQELLTQITDLAAGGQVTRVEYDPLYQVTRWEAGDTVREYQYASPRNLSFLGETETRLEYGDPARPGLLTAIQRGAEPAFAVPYDGNGNMTALPGRTLSWSFKNELAGLQRDDGLTAEYRYDHRGNRLYKRVQHGTQVQETIFLGDRVEIRDGQIAFYVMAGRSRVALVAGGRTRYIHGDYLGSGRFYTDENGVRISRIAYHPFGNLANDPGAAPGGGPAGGGVPGEGEPQIFALHLFDAESGLYYMGRRYYAPEIGRFLTPDPLYLYQPERGVTDPRSLALYTYVANDPINQVDPTGTSFWSVVGAIAGVIVGVAIGLAVVAAFATGIGFGLLALAGVVALVTVSYVTASATAGSGFGEFMRGFLIGLNAGLNGVFAAVIFGALLGPVGIALGVAVGVINFLAAFDTVANSEVYQGILGWSNLIMPMSWLVTGLGLIFFVLNLVGHIVTFGQVQFFEVTDIRVDWKTGTFFTQGGWISNLNPIDTGYNMGNFAFIDRNSTVPMADIIEHEAGHTLNLAVFGSIFHFIGAIDEMVLGNGANAYSEQLAESNVPGTTGPILPMWV